jgi:hypothetical protein
VRARRHARGSGQHRQRRVRRVCRCEARGQVSRSLRHGTFAQHAPRQLSS